MVRADGTKQRAGRSAISLHHIINKRKRYDPKAAKQKQFYAQAKQYKAYQRLLKREGYTTQPAQQEKTRTDEGDDDEQQQQQQQKKRKREDEQLENGGDDRKEPEVDEEVKTGRELDRYEVEDGEVPEQEWLGRKQKKRKAAPAVKTREQIRQEIAERQQRIADSRHVRAEKFKRHAQRTSKGQPIMAHRMEELLGKLRKQKQEANSSSKDHAAASTSQRANLLKSSTPTQPQAASSLSRTHTQR